MEHKQKLFYALLGFTYIRYGELDRAIKTYNLVDKKLSDEEYRLCGINAFKNGLFDFGIRCFYQINTKPTKKMLYKCVNVLMSRGSYKLAEEPIKKIIELGYFKSPD